MATKTAGTKPFYNDEIPAYWTTPEFGDVFTFLKSYAFSREQLTDEPSAEGIQNIHYGDIHATFENEVLDFELEKRIPFVKDGLIQNGKSDKEIDWLKDGDLIIADASEDYDGVAECIELRNVNGRKIVSGLHTFAARDKSGKSAQGYRTYLLNHPQVVRELRRIATGFSVFGISKTNITKVKLPLPPTQEQEAIADLLHLMDTAINKNNELIAKKELQKKGLIQKLLKGEVRLKNIDNKEWNQYTLGDLYQHKRGQLLSKEKLSPLGKFKCVLYGELFTTYAEVIDEVVNRTDFEEGTPSKYGDLLMPGSTTTTGIDLTVTTAILEDDVLLGGDINIFRMKNNLTDPVFMSYFLTHTQKRQLLRMPQGITIIHLYGSDLLGIKFKIPSIEEQIAIAQVLQAADTEIKLLKTKTDKLREKKKGLMQVLLTGKVRLNKKK